jgi:hypothetical protein
VSGRALAALLVGLAGAAGCRQVPDAFRCEAPTDCVDVDGLAGTCEPDGACSFPDEACPSGRRYGEHGEAELAGGCVAGCPLACDACEDDVCVFRCGDDGACAERVVCPPGLPCRVVCDGPGACAGGVECLEATACAVDCFADDACLGAIACGEGPCLVNCAGDGSCADGVDCAASCACDVDCGADACAAPLNCPLDCVNGEGECYDGSGCDTCG